MARMSEKEAGLERLKKRMTPQQRKDMAELLANELRSREAAKRQKEKTERGSSVKSSRMSTGLDRDQARLMYAEMQKQLKSGVKPKKSGFRALSGSYEQREEGTAERRISFTITNSRATSTGCTVALHTKAALAASTLC